MKKVSSISKFICLNCRTTKKKQLFLSKIEIATDCFLSGVITQVDKYTNVF